MKAVDEIRKLSPIQHRTNLERNITKIQMMSLSLRTVGPFSYRNPYKTDLLVLPSFKRIEGWGRVKTKKEQIGGRD